MRRERRAANVQKMRREGRNIEVQIDELVLHGFPVTERYVIGDALTDELKQLFSNNQSDVSFTNNMNIPTLNAGRIILPPNTKPSSAGMQVAKAVHQSLNIGSRASQT